jgi:hypothetical protein
MPAEMLADASGYKIETANQGVYNGLFRYIDMHNRTPMLEQSTEHLAMVDTSFNNSQSGSSFNTNTNTTTKA